MPDVTVVEADALDPSPVAPEGATWKRAFDTGRVLLVCARLPPRSATARHTHGERDAYGVVIAGRAAFDTGPETTRIAATGEFVHVPSGTAYRVRNPGDGEQDYLLWLTGSEPRVVRVDAPDAPD